MHLATDQPIAHHLCPVVVVVLVQDEVGGPDGPVRGDAELSQVGPGRKLQKRSFVQLKLKTKYFCVLVEKAFPGYL